MFASLTLQNQHTMKQSLLILSLFVFSLHSLYAQKYFKPVHGGIEHVETGKDYHLVEIQGKDSIQIYNALNAMVEKVFMGSQDRIIERKQNQSITASGVSPRALATFYDYKFTVEFKVKNGRYIFRFTNIELETSETSNGKTQRILLQIGTNLFREDENTVFMLRKGNKPNRMESRSYNDFIKYTDFFCDLFDISDEFEKYENSKEEDTKW